MAEEQTIQSLLDCLSAGDAAVRDLLIEHSMKKLQTLAHFQLQQSPRVRARHETDDIVQDAAIRLHRSLKTVSLATPRDFLSLAAEQIRRQLIDLARSDFGPLGSGANLVAAPQRDSNNAKPRDADLAVESESGPATKAERNDLYLRLMEKAGELPTEEREVFDLLHVHELPQLEAAKVLGVSVPTIKRRWRDARLHLHEAGIAIGAGE